MTVRVTDLLGADSQSYQVAGRRRGYRTDGPLFFATSGNGAVPGVDGPYNNADIYAYDGSGLQRILAFVATMGFNANVDALDIVDEDTFYVSFANNNQDEYPLAAFARWCRMRTCCYTTPEPGSVYFDGSSRPG